MSRFLVSKFLRLPGLPFSVIRRLESLSRDLLRQFLYEPLRLRREREESIQRLRRRSFSAGTRKERSAECSGPLSEAIVYPSVPADVARSAGSSVDVTT